MHKDAVLTTTNTVPEQLPKEQAAVNQIEIPKLQPQPEAITPVTEPKTEETPQEYKEFQKYGIIPKEAKYYETD